MHLLALEISHYTQLYWNIPEPSGQLCCCCKKQLLITSSLCHTEISFPSPATVLSLCPKHQDTNKQVLEDKSLRVATLLISLYTKRAARQSQFGWGFKEIPEVLGAQSTFFVLWHAMALPQVETKRTTQCAQAETALGMNLLLLPSEDKLLLMVLSKSCLSSLQAKQKP